MVLGQSTVDQMSGRQADCLGEDPAGAYDAAAGPEGSVTGGRLRRT
jgi:hypothetical protein